MPCRPRSAARLNCLALCIMLRMVCMLLYWQGLGHGQCNWPQLLLTVGSWFELKYLCLGELVKWLGWTEKLVYFYWTRLGSTWASLPNLTSTINSYWSIWNLRKLHFSWLRMDHIVEIWMSSDGSIPYLLMLVEQCCILDLSFATRNFNSTSQLLWSVVDVELTYSSFTWTLQEYFAVCRDCCGPLERHLQLAKAFRVTGC